MEQDAMVAAEAAEGYKFFYRTDPEMRDFCGPIEKVDDPVTGREMRIRDARISMMRGDQNLKPVKVWLDPIPHIRLAKGKNLQGWYSSKGDGANRGMRERPCMTDAILTQPYGGTCPVQCGFCYINQGIRGYRGAGLVSVPLGYGAQVARELASMQSSQAGYFSSFTDPFMALEDYYHNTQQGAQAFDDAGLPVFFLSRMSYPGWAFDLLQKNKYSYMQKSINTPDESDWSKLSPGAVSLEQHFEEIAEARRRGIYVSIQVNPVVAGIVTHDDIELLMEMLGDAGANHVIVKFVEAGFSMAGSMVTRMIKAFGDNRAAEFAALFTENQCGQQRTIAEEYRLEGHRRYQAAATKAGMTYATCYEYGRTDSGGWRSIGTDWLTGDTCHGHRVPFHVRPQPGHRFTELKVCPPSGCLHCADEKPAPCRSSLLASAKALKLPDLKQNPWG